MSTVPIDSQQTAYQSNTLIAESFNARDPWITARCSAAPSSVSGISPTCKTSGGAMHLAIEDTRNQLDRQAGIKNELLEVEALLVDPYQRDDRVFDARLVKHDQRDFEVFVWTAADRGLVGGYRSVRRFESKSDAEHAINLALAGLKPFTDAAEWTPLSFDDRIGVRAA